MSGYVGSKRSSSLVSATDITLDGAKLKSSGDSITKSDGTTAVLSESSGTVTLTVDGLTVDGAGSFSTNLSIRTTSSPSGYNLHVSQDDSDKALAKFTNTTTGTTTSDGFDVGINAVEEALIFHNENKPIIFGTNGTERMRIESNGSFIHNSNNGSQPFYITREGSTNQSCRIEVGDSTVAFSSIQDESDFGAFSFKLGHNSGVSSNAAFHVYDSDGTGLFRVNAGGSVVIDGSLSKGSGSFRIDHPLKPETHHLVHSFVEAPQADNIYRGKVDLVNGTSTVNIDTVAGMTEGTFAALNREIQCFTSNESGWTAVRGTVSGNILTIEAQDNTCTDTISWMVIGERQDQHMIETDWTDENGKVIVEQQKTLED